MVLTRQYRLQVNDPIDLRRFMTTSRIVTMGGVVTVINIVRMPMIRIVLDAAATVVTVDLIVAVREVVAVPAMHTGLVLIAGTDMRVHIVERHQRHAEVQQHANDRDEAAHDRQSNQTRALCTTSQPARG